MAMGWQKRNYIMGLTTKQFQQIIENYFSRLCKFIPNELISIPSNKRMQDIHSMTFESQLIDKNRDDYSWVMDCRKWAPKSNFTKFIIFLAGMDNALPKSFINHCIYVFSKFYKKRLYFNEKLYNSFKDNLSFEDYMNYFCEDDETRDEKWMEVNAEIFHAFSGKKEMKKKSNNKLKYMIYKPTVNRYIVMPYSWMMGIFNYLSSFMHAMNQLYNAHLISIASRIYLKAENIITPKAHSDDSAAKQTIVVYGEIHSSKDVLKKTVYWYELLLKCCNHLLSKKKVCIGKVYFELLSVLYLNNELLPLIAKFAGGLNFKPTNKGYVEDMFAAYNSVIELTSNGSYFDESYLAEILLTHAIFRFYFNKHPKKIHYNLPPHCMGVPDAHPMSIFITGSDADLIRIQITNEKLYKAIRAVNMYFIGSGETGSHFPYVTPPLVRFNVPKKQSELLTEVMKLADEKLLSSWTLMNANTGITFFNMIKFVYKMNKDPLFINSLQNESLVKRISHSFYYRGVDLFKNYPGSSYKSYQKLFEAIVINSEMEFDTSHMKGIFVSMIGEGDFDKFVKF